MEIWENINPKQFRNGRPKDFGGPETLWRACIRYVHWNKENPISLNKVMVVDGTIHRPKIRKPRAMTLEGLCTFLGVTTFTWRNWKRNRPDLLECQLIVEQIVWRQKFELASLGEFNPAIIARELGLAEKSEFSGPNGGPIETITSDMTPEAAATAYAKMRKAV